MTIHSQSTENQIKEMSLFPKPGEILLYMDLHYIENMTHWEALKLAESLGFKPELRARSWMKDDQQQFGIYALLHYEKREYDSALEADYITDRAFEELAHRIVPSIAVHFTYKLKRGRVAEIAA